MGWRGEEAREVEGLYHERGRSQRHLFCQPLLVWQAARRVADSKHLRQGVATMETRHHDFETPLGMLRFVESDRGLQSIHRSEAQGASTATGAALIAASQVSEFFLGIRQRFDVELDLVGTDFQKLVWNALLQIQFGKTRSYGDIARDIGSPKAAQAVGAANGQNPIPIIVPCHRVVGAKGELTGFAWGLAAKRQLLSIESCQQELF